MIVGYLASNDETTQRKVTASPAPVLPGRVTPVGMNQGRGLQLPAGPVVQAQATSLS